ncbi:YkgJ family cysteine cluster protein [Desulfotomaculum defluvii]
MLQQVELYTALSKAEQNNLFTKLAEVYEALPNTSCTGCATCCNWGSPPAFFIEYLNLYKYIRDNQRSEWQGIVKKSAEYFYLELVDPNQKCPFLNDDKKCSVYEVRPFSCRSYGLLSKKDFETGNRGLQQLAKKLKEDYDLVIPQEIIDYEIPWCDKVTSDVGSYMAKSTLAGYAAQIGTLDCYYFPQDLVDQEGSLLPYPIHLANTVLSTGARARKIKIMKQYTEGSRELLDGILNKALDFQF